jgi:hypothetical protein
MQKRDHEMPEPTRSAAEIEFLLRHAGRKTGPAMLRDLAGREPAEAGPGEATSRRRPPRQGDRLTAGT